MTDSDWQTEKNDGASKKLTKQWRPVGRKLMVVEEFIRGEAAILREKRN